MVMAYLDLYDRMRTGLRGMFDFDGRMSVSRPLVGMVQRLTPEKIQSLTESAIDAHPSLHAVDNLVTLAGHRENAGRQLVDEPHASNLEARLRHRIETSDPQQLAGTRRLLYLLWHLFRPAEDATEPALGILMHPVVLPSLVKSALSPVRTATQQSSSVGYRLQWPILVAILGGQTNVAAAATILRDLLTVGALSPDEDLTLALTLVDEYLSGGRPMDPWDED